MLTIRDAQIATLDAHAVNEFLRRACVFLREHLTGDVASADDARLLAFARASCESAAKRGVVTERGLLMWMCLRIMAGSRFYEIPEIAALLAAGQNGDETLRALSDRLAVLETRQRTAP